MALCTLSGCKCENSTISADSLLDFVDPLIGTGGHGHTFPGAAYPFGMVQLSPDTGLEGWDWCSGFIILIVRSLVFLIRIFRVQDVPT